MHIFIPGIQDSMETCQEFYGFGYSLSRRQ